MWEQVKGDIVLSEQGYVLFDDVVLDERHSRKVDDSEGAQGHRRVDNLRGSENEMQRGKLI